MPTKKGMMMSMDEIMRHLKSQRDLILDVDKRVVHRIERMRLFDQEKENTVVATDVETKEIEEKKERSNNIYIDDGKQETNNVSMTKRTFFDVRTAARLSARRFQRNTGVGG
jgi:hypothetical protein